MLPVEIENKNKQEIEAGSQVFTNLAAQYFKGRNAEIFQDILSRFEFKDSNQFMETILSFMNQRINFETLNNSDIEQIDIIGLVKELAGELNYTGESIEISEKETEKFENSMKDFSHSVLHDVAFPLLLIENPNLAPSAKNLIKRVISSMQSDEGIDMSDVYQTLEIENLPTEFTMDMFLRLGGNIPGLAQQTTIDEAVKDSPCILFCELSPAQAVYLAHVLHTDYYAVKNWKALYHLLKSNGKKYDSIVVDNERKGILLSVLHGLYEKKTVTNDRYLRTNGENGIWDFFQGFLIDSKTDQPFNRELRKLRSENCEKEKAQKIIDEIFNPTNTNTINETVKEILKKDKI